MENGATIHERITVLVRVYGNGKNTEFAKLTGVSEANIRGYTKDILPKADFLEKIVRCCDNVSAEWLLTGEGSMYKVAEQSKDVTNAPPIQAEGSPMADALLAQLAEKDRQIAQLLAIISNK